MSEVSKLKNEFLSFLEGLKGRLTPEAAADVDAAAQPVHEAIADVESAAVSTAASAAVAVAPSVEAMVSKDVPAEYRPIAVFAMQTGLAAVVARLQGSTASPA